MRVVLLLDTKKFIIQMTNFILVFKLINVLARECGFIVLNAEGISANRIST